MSVFDAEIEIQQDPDQADQWGYVVTEGERLVDLLRFTLESESVTGTWLIVVVLTSDDHLRRLHAQFMGIDEETDVMTFPYDTEPGPLTYGGDIVISVDRAIDNGQTYSVTPQSEIAFLAVHGTLHLCGWLDSSETERAAMLERQQTIIASFDRRLSTNPD